MYINSIAYNMYICQPSFMSHGARSKTFPGAGFAGETGPSLQFGGGRVALFPGRPGASARGRGGEVRELFMQVDQAGVSVANAQGGQGRPPLGLRQRSPQQLKRRMPRRMTGPGPGEPGWSPRSRAGAPVWAEVMGNGKVRPLTRPIPADCRSMGHSGNGCPEDPGRYTRAGRFFPRCRLRRGP